MNKDPFNKGVDDVPDESGRDPFYQGIGPWPDEPAGHPSYEGIGAWPGENSEGLFYHRNEILSKPKNCDFGAFTNCIIIGDHLDAGNARYSFHLLVDHAGVKIDKVMTEEEYNIIWGVLIALGHVKIKPEL